MRHAAYVFLAAVVAAACGHDEELLLSPSDGPVAEVGEGTHDGPFLLSSIAASEHHTCALSVNGRAFCWGQNDLGQLGTDQTTQTCGPFPCSRTPLPVASELAFSAIVSGENHTCAIAKDGQAYCWGWNSTGQLGDGSGGGDAFSRIPVAVVGGLRFKDLALGKLHTCGLTRAGKAYCWGNNGDHALGNPSVSFSFTPIEVVGGLLYTKIASGLQHTCGLTADRLVYCWGKNNLGQFGNGTTTDGRTPTLAAGGMSFRSIDANRIHTCGISIGGDAFCWGINNRGQLGTGSTMNATSPQLVAGLIKFSVITAGGRHTCGATAAGVGYCWGLNQGQLGTGDAPEICNGEPCTTTPIPVEGGLSFEAMSAGISGNHTCAITKAKAGYCWGLNFVGQLGNGTTSTSFVPVRVAGPH